MTPRRQASVYPAAINLARRAMCLALLIAVVGSLLGARTGEAQIGGPVLTVDADPQAVRPGDQVTLTVVAFGAGSYADITIDIPNALTIVGNVNCVHSTLYCSGTSVSALDASTQRLSASAPGAVSGPDGPSSTTRVTITLSISVPTSAVPGTEYEIVSSVQGLFNILDPTSTTDKRDSTVVDVLDDTGRSVPPSSSSQLDAPSIQDSKKVCGGRAAFPVYVESHCIDVPDASFMLVDPRSLHSEVLVAGEQYAPEERYFAGSRLWSLQDASAQRSTQGVRIVSCLESQPGANWHSSVPRVVIPDEGDVLLDWMFTGGANETYQPWLDCVWLELPDLDAMPAVLSLQVFTAETPYLTWTELTGSPLPDVGRGESGEDLEADMVMTNLDTGDVYSFAADAYGQVLVPSGTYSLVESASGLEECFYMGVGQTTLVEVGLAGSTVLQSRP